MFPRTKDFDEILNRVFLQAQRYHKNFALLFIAIDHDETVSDQLLDELNQRFNAALRAGDILVPLDKNKFAVLLTDLEQPLLSGSVAEKLLRASAFPTTIAIGIFPHDGKTLEELQQRTANTLSQIKNQGGNQYQFVTPQMTVEAQDLIHLQTALRQALQNNEFILYYQPKLDLKTKTLSGVEALIRWKHPVLGLIDPLQFIPSAEETNLILQIGEWVLREACRTNKQWQKDGYQALVVTVNLSPKQFYQPQLCKIVEEVLKETALDPCYLELEITEMTILNDTPQVNHILHSLKSLGLTLAIDDFGTGHTSISYLKNFPITTVKIDQSFIKPLPENKNAAITRAIISLAHQLGIKVVAEGVETLEQLQSLAELQCDQVQGYFISQPLPASKMVDQLMLVH